MKNKQKKETNKQQQQQQQQRRRRRQQQKQQRRRQQSNNKNRVFHNRCKTKPGRFKLNPILFSFFFLFSSPLPTDSKICSVFF